MRMNKFFAVLIAVMLLASLPAIAMEKIDTGKDVRLSISFSDDGMGLSGAQFDIYRVAKIDKAGKATLIAPFDKYNVDIHVESESEMGDIARTLEGYVLRDHIAPTESAVTDRMGNVFFPASGKKLQQGLYLVLGNRYSGNGRTYIIQPGLVMLPTLSVDKTQWLYDLEIKPKYDSEEDTPDGATITRKVLKVWEDHGHEKARPKSIDVQLLRDGEIFDTVTLNTENLWRHSWVELEADHHWTVVEKEPKNYNVLVTQEGITFVVTNTYDAPDEPGPTPPPDTPPGKLPQTGQMWWPVPMLVSIGLLFIVIGLIRRRGNN